MCCNPCWPKSFKSLPLVPCHSFEKSVLAAAQVGSIVNFSLMYFLAPTVGASAVGANLLQKLFSEQTLQALGAPGLHPGHPHVTWSHDPGGPDIVTSSCLCFTAAFVMMLRCYGLPLQLENSWREVHYLLFTVGFCI